MSNMYEGENGDVFAQFFESPELSAKMEEHAKQMEENKAKLLASVFGNSMVDVLEQTKNEFKQFVKDKE